MVLKVFPLTFSLIIYAATAFFTSKKVPTVNEIEEDLNLSKFLPHSGFISGERDSVKYIVRLIKKVDRPSVCESLEVINIPSPNVSPLVGSPIFSRVTGGLYNGKFAWSNGQEYISFIQASGERNHYGNWLIGIEPGEDKGYVYFSTSQESSASLVPVDIVEPGNNFY